MKPKAFIIVAALATLLPASAHAEDPCDKNHFILDYPCQVNVLRNWRWTPAGELNVPRILHSATLLPDGRVLVTGGLEWVRLGSTMTTRVSTAAELYDPATGVSRLTAPMSVPRGLHQATRLLDGRVLVTDDRGGEMNSRSLGLTGIAEIYDAVSGQWTLAGRMNTPRTAHTMTLLADGRVLVAGGVDDGDDTLASAELYDPADNTWRYTGSMQTGRFQHTATHLGDGTVLVTGGSTDDFWQVVTASAERYDPATGAWSPVANLSVARQWHTAASLPDGDILIIGGYGSTPDNDYNPTSYGTVDRFGASGWSVASALNVPRQGHASAEFAGGMVLVTGGKDWGQTPYNWWGSTGTVEAYDPAIRAWRIVADMNVMRGSHTATTLLDGRVVVIGGYSNARLGFDDDPAPRSIEVFGPSRNAALGMARYR